MKPYPVGLLIFALAAATPAIFAETPSVPDWALPGTATHKQVPPPADFHRATTTYKKPIGIFDGQSDIGTAVVPGSASFDKSKNEYIIKSAGYNIWYTRDEFRYLWKKVSGDVSLAANISMPNEQGYGDRKVVLIIRQDLDDDSKEVMTALHGAGLIHLAERPTKGAEIKEDCRIESSQTSGGKATTPVRLGIEKNGDNFALYVSIGGEPMHQVGPMANVHFDAPFYVGIGFTSHQPATVDTAIVSNVVFANTADKVH